MATTMKYLYESQIGFTKIDSNIYRVCKDKVEIIRKGKYITATQVVDILNNSPYKVSIYDDRMVFIHANFELGDED